jgi:hypothetical protein
MNMIVFYFALKIDQQIVIKLISMPTFRLSIEESWLRLIGLNQFIRSKIFLKHQDVLAGVPILLDAPPFSWDKFYLCLRELHQTIFPCSGIPKLLHFYIRDLNL